MTGVPANRWLAFLSIAAGGLAWDLYSKAAVFNDLGYPHQVSLWTSEYFGGWMTFRLFTSFNHGALWGIGQGYTSLFAGLSVVAVFGVLYWLFVVGAARSWWLTVALGLILAGTLGNLYDRLGWHGCTDRDTGATLFAVRDFLLFTFGDFHWPVFNFADVFLVTAAVMLVLQSFRPASHEPASTSGSE